MLKNKGRRVSRILGSPFILANILSTTATMSALLFFRLAANMPGCESMPNSSLIVGRLSTIDRRVANGTSCRGRAARGLPRPSYETSPVWYFWRFSDIFLYYIARLFMVSSMWKSERRNESWSSPRNVVAAVNTCRDISELPRLIKILSFLSYRTYGQIVSYEIFNPWVLFI